MPETKIKDTLHRWQTWWSIVGPKLPSCELRLHGNIILAPLTEETFARMKASRAPVIKLTPSTDSFVVRYPPRDEVQSRHRLQIDVDAPDADAACDLSQKIADRLALSLTLSVECGWYFVELRKIRIAEEKCEYSAWSESPNATPLPDPVEIEMTELKKGLAIFQAAENDPTAENAYIHLLSAWQLQATAGSKPLGRSILQHYVLCMEAVVNGVIKNVRTERRDKIRLDERKFASEFTESFLKRADKPKAIREASNKLREISLQNTIPSIEVVSEVLNLPEETTRLAAELYRFRSRSLSHPGRSENEGFKKWLRSGPKITELCLADVVARSFFVAYCDKCTAQGKRRKLT